MGKAMPKQPTPADPARVASTQGNLNRDTAVTQQIMNMGNQTGPDGSINRVQRMEQQFITPQYTKKGKLIKGTGTYVDVPVFDTVTTLSADQQRLRDLNNQSQEKMAQLGTSQLDRLSATMSAPINFEGAPARAAALNLRGGVNKDFSADRKRIEDALFSRMQPQMDRSRDQLRAQLINRGVREGTEQFDAAMGDLGRQENDARLAVVGQGGDEQARLFGMEAQNNQLFDQAAIQSADSQNKNRAAFVEELLTKRNQPINEISALLSGNQVNMPQLQQSAQAGVGGVDFQGAVQNYDTMKQRNYEQQVAQRNAAMGGMFGLLSAPFAAFSDIRLKKNVRKIGALPNGLGVYRYSYIWSCLEENGLIAQEVALSRPDAVSTHSSGFFVVDYVKATA